MKHTIERLDKSKSYKLGDDEEWKLKKKLKQD